MMEGRGWEGEQGWWRRGLEGEVWEGIGSLGELVVVAGGGPRWRWCRRFKRDYGVGLSAGACMLAAHEDWKEEKGR